MRAMGAVDPRVERSREAILGTAVELLLEGGTPAVTVDAIVERSGVARTTVYRHFGSRREVVAAAFERLVPDAVETPKEGAPLREALEAYVLAFAERLARGPWANAMPVLIEAAGRDPEIAGVLDRVMEARQAPLRRIVGRAVDNGELPPETDAGEVMSQLVGPLVFRRLVTREPIDAGFCRHLVSLFLSSRAVTEPSPEVPAADQEASSLSEPSGFG